MPNKYKALLQIDSSGSLREAFVYADSEAEAREILNAMNPGLPVNMLQVVEEQDSKNNESTEPSSKKGGCGSIIVVLLAVLLYGTWQAITGQNAAPESALESPTNEEPDINSPSLIAPSEQISEISESSALGSGTDEGESSVPSQLDSPGEQIESPTRDLPSTPTPAETPASSLAGTLSAYEALVRDASGDLVEIQISAKSEDDARRILRDYRGNPEVVSVQPTSPRLQ